jgi:hypothetical protein
VSSSLLMKPFARSAPKQKLDGSQRPTVKRRYRDSTLILPKSTLRSLSHRLAARFDPLQTGGKDIRAHSESSPTSPPTPHVSVSPCCALRKPSLPRNLCPTLSLTAASMTENQSSSERYAAHRSPRVDVAYGSSPEVRGGFGGCLLFPKKQKSKSAAGTSQADPLRHFTQTFAATHGLRLHLVRW